MGVSNWGALKNNPIFIVFIDLYNFLKATNKLEAELNFEWTSGEKTNEGLPLTLGTLITQHLPEGVARYLAEKQMRGNSKKIGHCLDYQLYWGPLPTMLVQARTCKNLMDNANMQKPNGLIFRNPLS